jgi:hypothetical protein
MGYDHDQDAATHQPADYQENRVAKGYAGKTVNTK